MTHQAAMNKDHYPAQCPLKTMQTSTLPQPCEKFPAALIQVKEGMTLGTPTKLFQEAEEPDFHKINPGVLQSEATRPQPDISHKRKMVNQEPAVARNFRTRVIQSQPNQAPTATPLITPESALLPSMEVTRNNIGGQSQ